MYKSLKIRPQSTTMSLRAVGLKWSLHDDDDDDDLPQDYAGVVLCE